MNYKRLATAKNRSDDKEKYVIIIEIENKTVAIKQKKLDDFSTLEELVAEVERQAGQELDVFFHFNRDGYIAMGTGVEPDPWPEDELEE